MIKNDVKKIDFFKKSRSMTFSGNKRARERDSKSKGWKGEFKSAVLQGEKEREREKNSSTLKRR